MGVLSRLTSLFQREEKATIESWHRMFGQELTTASGMSVSQTTAMKVTAVLACVRIRSQDVAKLPPKIYRVASDGSKQEARNHYLSNIFRRPNELQTWFEFCEQMQMAMLLRGNAYAPVVRDAAGYPVAMIPVNPDRVSIYESPSPDGSIFYNIARGSPYEMAALASFPQRIPAGDVFHLRWASSNSIVGLSPIALAAESIGLARSQERLASNLMGNGARPSGVLTTDKKLAGVSFDRLKASWESFTGPNSDRSGSTAILEEGVKWQALTLNSVDMEFIASRKLQIEEICRIFGVSPIKIGVLDASLGRAFEQIQLAHYVDAIHPDLVRWEDKMKHYFNLEPNIDIKFDETEILRADLLSRANAARVLQVSGITTPNESRLSFGLNPYISRPGVAPDGDTLFTPNNVVPIEMAGQISTGAGPGSDQTGAPAAGGSGDPAMVEPAG